MWHNKAPEEAPKKLTKDIITLFGYASSKRNVMDDGYAKYFATNNRINI
jgi:hypothetical protein